MKVCVFSHVLPKRGDVITHDGFKRISGTKIHVAVEQNGLPISIVVSPANKHDSTRCIVVENILEYLDDDSIESIISVCADKGYDSNRIQDYLKDRNIIDCIPHRNFKTTDKKTNQNRYNKICSGEALCMAQMWISKIDDSI